MNQSSSISARLHKQNTSLQEIKSSLASLALVTESEVSVLNGIKESLVGPSPLDGILQELPPFSSTLLDYSSQLPLNPIQPAVFHTSDIWRIWALSTTFPYPISRDCKVVYGGRILRDFQNGSTYTAQGMAVQSQFAASDQATVDALDFVTPNEMIPMGMNPEALEWLAAFMAGETPSMSTWGEMCMLHGDGGEMNNLIGTGDHLVTTSPEYIKSYAHTMWLPYDAGTRAIVDGMSHNPFEGTVFTMFKGTPYTHSMVPFSNFYDFTDTDTISLADRADAYDAAVPP